MYWNCNESYFNDFLNCKSYFYPLLKSWLGNIQQNKEGIEEGFKLCKNKIIKPTLNIASKAALAIGMAVNAIVPGSGALITGAIGWANAVMNAVDRGQLSNAYGSSRAVLSAMQSSKIRLK